MSKNIKRMFVESGQTDIETAYQAQLINEFEFERKKEEDDVDIDVDALPELPEEITAPKLPKVVDSQWINKRVYEIYKFITNLQKDFVGNLDLKETKENEKLVTEINKDMLEAASSMINLVRSTKKLMEIEGE